MVDVTGHLPVPWNQRMSHCVASTHTNNDDFRDDDHQLAAYGYEQEETTDIVPLHS